MRDRGDQEAIRRGFEERGRMTATGIGDPGLTTGLDRLSEALDPDHRLGHTYFMRAPLTAAVLDRLWRTAIRIWTFRRC